MAWVWVFKKLTVSLLCVRLIQNARYVVRRCALVGRAYPNSIELGGPKRFVACPLNRVHGNHRRLVIGTRFLEKLVTGHCKNCLCSPDLCAHLQRRLQ